MFDFLMSEVTLPAWKYYLIFFASFLGALKLADMVIFLIEKNIVKKKQLKKRKGGVKK